MQAKKVFEEQISVQNAYGSDQYFEFYARQIPSSLYHQVGTAKMGPTTDRFAVIDLRLAVHGLRVIDHSQNTKYTAIMIAERGSDTG